MPSGHIQACFFSLFTIIFVVRHTFFTIIGIITTIITGIQRYKYKNHTFEQIVGGAIVGITLFYLTQRIYSISHGEA
jgi:membrane-associated phospholipid phosphatase